jgi:hypothetical protein
MQLVAHHNTPATVQGMLAGPVWRLQLLPITFTRLLL